MKLLKSISELIRTQKLIIAYFNQMHLLICLSFVLFYADLKKAVLNNKQGSKYSCVSISSTEFNDTFRGNTFE